jgi:predicted nucleic acid-binding protein
LKAIVVDTNILFSTLLGKNKKFRDILLSDSDVKLCSSKYAIVELFKYKEKIKKYSSLNEDEVLDLLYNLLKRIQLVDESTLTETSLEQAFNLCYDVDEKDIPFVAVTIELNGLLWTGDIKLKEGLKKKGFYSFFEVE